MHINFTHYFIFLFFFLKYRLLVSILQCISCCRKTGPGSGVNMEEAYHLPITGELDLHTFRPDETKSAVEEYVNECARHGIRFVRIIHGKGRSVQKQIVRSVLSRHPLVVQFSDAPPEQGGWGATTAEIKTAG